MLTVNRVLQATTVVKVCNLVSLKITLPLVCSLYFKCQSAFYCTLTNSIVKISMTSQALLRNIYGWQKAIKTKEMTENLCTSKDCRYTYMLHFILKSGGKLEYQDYA